AEDALLDLLRRTGDAVELERRLARRLARLPVPENSDEEQRAASWLELAHLRHERLHRVGDAAEAYGEALALAPDELRALRGLRTCAGRLGRHAVVAETLEKELDVRAEATAPERAALYRTRGELAGRELDETTRASRAFAAALEADPTDRVSLSSLQTLFETMEDWRGAADLYESEVSILSDDETERCQAAWLRVGAISRDQLEDSSRALAAYDAAAGIAPLALSERAKHAELLHLCGDAARFVEVFASWLDAEGADGRIADHLRLADVLEELGRHEAALARVERALALEPERSDAWDAAARLNDRLGRKQDAAEAHERAAACTHGAEAASRRLAAALKVTGEEDRLRLLDRAVADDPAFAEAHARLAICAGGLGQVAHAERAALRTTELASASELSRELLLEAALAGGRAAQLQEHAVQALGLFDAVLSLEPDHGEALAGHGDVALQLGDAALARPSLERLLELSDDHPDRATHLTQLGAALKIEGDAGPALERFQAALELDPRLDEAHRGLAELFEREERIDEAVDALQKWAARTQEPEVRAGRLMHAARLELDRPDREEPAEALLREAVDSLPDHAEAWTLLCQLLWAQGRVTEALDQATRAVEALGTGMESATCALIRGRALEQRGDHRAAADAFRSATAADPRCSEGALSAARLLRALGEWRESADVLQDFVDRAPDDAREHLAPAWHQLGRLLAGPLEDVDGAIEVYRRAFEADPTLADARHALADLLIHRQERWDEAVALHLELLAEDPTRLTSLRGLLHVARGRERNQAVDTGLAILRALGCATPEERLEAPARLPGAAEAQPVSDETGEVLRQLAVEISEEIGEALGVGGAGDGPPGGGAGDPIKRLRSALIRTEGDLLAPA
ncbi:MAG: tetratricopeptide repeat protein, partial [Myxococcota bacterium]